MIVMDIADGPPVCAFAALMRARWALLLRWSFSRLTRTLFLFFHHHHHQILLVTSSRMTDHWIVPGGGVEPNEDASEAAIRETEEEAGVRGVIKRCLGDFEVCDEKRERKHRTSVYVLQVGEELTEWEDCKGKAAEQRSLCKMSWKVCFSGLFSPSPAVVSPGGGAQAAGSPQAGPVHLHHADDSDLQHAAAVGAAPPHSGDVSGEAAAAAAAGDDDDHLSAAKQRLPPQWWWSWSWSWSWFWSRWCRGRRYLLYWQPSHHHHHHHHQRATVPSSEPLPERQWQRQQRQQRQQQQRKQPRQRPL